MRGRKFHMVTLGCKINQHETQALTESWLAAGASLLDGPEGAEVLVVNTCAVTARAVGDCRAMIRRLHRAAPGAEIVVTGCAAQVAAGEFVGLPGVSRVVPQQDKRSLLLDRSEFAIADYPRARPVVRVQDGCDHHCAFCIVPTTRGPGVSRPVASVLAEARRLLAAGFRELVLSGVNLRLYGRDLPERPDFWDLLAALECDLAPEWAGRARLRLSSLDPGQLIPGPPGDKGLEVLAGSRMLCRHLHLSLQSGHAGVLRRMGRGHYGPETAADFLARLAGSWPLFGLGADLLVGFPGETPEAFEETYAYVRSLPLTYAHVFPFSPRPGTRAAGMVEAGEGVDPAEAKDRAARLRGLAARRRRAFLERLLERGLPLEVVVQDADGAGVSSEYAPCRVSPVGDGGAGLVRTMVRGVPQRLAAGKLLLGPPECPTEAGA